MDWWKVQWRYFYGNIYTGMMLFTLQVCHTYKIENNPLNLKIDPPPLIHDYIPPACWNFTYGNPAEMSFYTPSYPNEYPPNVECVTYFAAPPRFKIELVFMEKFSVEESQDCKYDFIELRDGPFGYSPLIAQFCSTGFPVTIQTKSRYLWARFKSDGELQYGGFKAVYEYKINDDYNEVKDKLETCRIYLDHLTGDGILTSSQFPLVKPHEYKYPEAEPVDCTWELHVPRGHQVRLSGLNLGMQRRGQCDKNVLEIYDASTSETDKAALYCNEDTEDFVSTSNRIFIRLYGQRLAWKPQFKAMYTVFTSGDCDKGGFQCDGMCLPMSLVCNGHHNCPSGLDEQNCDATAASNAAVGGLPLHFIIIAAVGGVFIIGVFIGVCLTCRYKKAAKRNQRDATKHQEKHKNALEMAVVNSSNTSHQLAKQNNPNYYSLPRPSAHATMMQRGSLSSKPPSEGDYGDHMSDSSNYKKFLQLDQTLDDEDSRCPSPSPFTPGHMFTTIVEQHPSPQGLQQGDIVWQGQYPDYPGSPTLAENLSKLAQYNSTLPKHYQHTPDIHEGMTMEFKYDPTPPTYPASKFRIKQDHSYGWNPEYKYGKSLTFKNVDADSAPDITKQIGTT